MTTSEAQVPFGSGDAGPAVEAPALIPARMVNEFVYCPRLAHLMWSQAEWTDTGDTTDGRWVHRRADRPGQPLPDPGEIDRDRLDPVYPMVVSRSVTLSSERIGVIAKIDIAEMHDGGVTVVDYKRGKRPHTSQGVFEPERVQLCLQAMLLEDNGYVVHGGSIYFAESRERVAVEFDSELRRRALDAVAGLRSIGQSSDPPPPLVDSPKCPRCALVTVCLPDEVNWLIRGDFEPRPIAVPADDALPLIVQSGFARVSKDGDRLRIEDKDGRESFARFIDVSDVAVFGAVNFSTPALTALMDREIPVTFHTFAGWFKGMTQGVGHRNIDVRVAQYRASFDEATCLRFSRTLIAAKIQNQRTILRRNWRGTEGGRREALGRLAISARAARRAVDQASLLGVEGDAAAVYFRAFAGLLAPRAVSNGSTASAAEFRFDRRNRRPPTDPVNAMLSLAYAMLTRHFTVALASVGLDPFRGLYHAQRYGRPSLALDLMEPFRPIICDSVVLGAVNTGALRASDFLTARTGVSLTVAGRRRFVEAFERRLAQEAVHPIFGYRLSMRRTILVQARLLTRFLVGEIPAYPHYLPR